MRPRLLVPLFALACLANQAVAGESPYTKSAGKNAPTESVSRRVIGDDGVERTETVEAKPTQDRFGNAQGNQHDLAIDGAFEGQTVAVIQLYTIDFDFSLPKKALKEKGFSVYRWVGKPPSPSELAKALEKSSQLWVIADSTQQLNAEHLEVIKKFFDAGHGVYVWGDNQPYYADANYIAQALFGTSMEGDLFGDQTVGVQKQLGKPGLLPNHLLTTGLENIYEGITIATIKPTADLKPLIYGSAGNLVAAYYDKGGKRAIFDGGFTRLYIKWDTAGTPRYVKNAASWLVNAEKFGDAVVAIKKPPVAPAATIAKGPAPTTVSASIETAPNDGFFSRTTGLILVSLMVGCMLLLYLPLRRRA